MTLIVITPGPTLTVYRDGRPMLEVPLSTQEALHIIAGLAKEIRICPE